MTQTHQTARAGEKPVLQCLSLRECPLSIPYNVGQLLAWSTTFRGFTRRWFSLRNPQRVDPRAPTRQRTGWGLLPPPQPGHKIQNLPDSVMSLGAIHPRFKKPGLSRFC